MKSMKKLKPDHREKNMKYHVNIRRYHVKYHVNPREIPTSPNIRRLCNSASEDDDGSNDDPLNEKLETVLLHTARYQLGRCSCVLRFRVEDSQGIPRARSGRLTQSEGYTRACSSQQSFRDYPTKTITSCWQPERGGPLPHAYF